MTSTPSALRKYCLVKLRYLQHRPVARTCIIIDDPSQRRDMRCLPLSDGRPSVVRPFVGRLVALESISKTNQDGPIVSIRVFPKVQFHTKCTVMCCNLRQSDITGITFINAIIQKSQKTDQYLRYFTEFQCGIDIASISKVQYRSSTTGNSIYLFQMNYT